MADNVTLNAGAGGSVAAADDIGSVFYQRVKLSVGADGTAVDAVPVSNGLDTTATGVQAVGLVGHFDDVATGTVTENQFAPVRITSARRLMTSTAVDTALPAGTNAIGKLAANSGVDIGDVDVTSVVPGVTATSLGKAEDAAHTTGDTGVMLLAVRNDAGTAMAGTTGDYIPLGTDANGNLLIAIAADSVGSTVDTEDGTVATGQSSVALTIAQNYEYDGTNWTRPRGANTVAHDAADAGNPQKVGAKAKSALSGITLVASDDRTDLYADLDGVLLARAASLGDVVQERTTNTDGASTAFASGLAAPGANVRLWVTNVDICNSSATFCTVDLRDGSAGSVLWTLPVPATGGVVKTFDPPLKLTANTALAFDASAATTTLTISANAFNS